MRHPVHVITPRALIRQVADHWRRQYPTAKGNDHFAVIWRKLVELDKEVATAAEVNEIIGNPSWTVMPACEQCGIVKSAVAVVGEEEYYDSRTAYLCRECLQAGIDAIDAALAKEE